MCTRLSWGRRVVTTNQHRFELPSNCEPISVKLRSSGGQDFAGTPLKPAAKGGRGIELHITDEKAVQEVIIYNDL